ncbi:hypothetical protein ACLOJK_035666 [Asimina triloba]
MGRASPRLPSFCLNRLVMRVRVRSPPVPAEPKRISNAVKAERVAAFSSNPAKDSDEKMKPVVVIGRRIMIVVDSSQEAKSALQWALSHTVQNQDTMVLLYVTKEVEEEGKKGMNARGYELLHSMKNMCQAKKPEVQVEVVLVGGKEKGPTIVEEARRQGISLLVLGQRKRSTTWRLLMTWAGNRMMGGGVVEYCISNAECLTLAVRRKSRKLGGGFRRIRPSRLSRHQLVLENTPIWADFALLDESGRVADTALGFDPRGWAMHGRSVIMGLDDVGASVMFVNYRRV